MTVCFGNANRFFDTITNDEIQDQTTYWSRIKPTSIEDVFRRWLFAFVSPRTSWQNNVRGYLAIKDFMSWKWNRAELTKRLRKSGAGLHFDRAENIWRFTRSFWENPNLYFPKAGEHWWAYRDRLKEISRGIGRAKTSFGLEMIFPNTTKVVCADIHQCRLYGLPSTLAESPKMVHAYDKLEYHWVTSSKERGLSPFYTRNIYWNRVSKKPNTRFWSHVFETNELRSQLDAQEQAVNEKTRRDTEEPLLVWAERNLENENKVVCPLQQA